MFQCCTHTCTLADKGSSNIQSSVTHRSIQLCQTGPGNAWKLIQATSQILTCIQRVHVGAMQLALRHFCLCRKITDKAADLYRGSSFLECLMRGCTFRVLGFILGLKAAYHRRRNNGKPIPTDLNKTFQVVVAANRYVEKSSCPQTSNCLALSYTTEMKSSLLNRPRAYTIPPKLIPQHCESGVSSQICLVCDWPGSQKGHLPDSERGKSH